MRRCLPTVSALLMGIFAATACDGAGDLTPLAVGASGEALIRTYLDRNGDFNFVEPVDTPLVGVPVRLVQRGTDREVARGVSDARGALLLSSVPVGSYEVRVDRTFLGDSLAIATIGSGTLTVGAVDTANLQVVVEIPSVSLRAARATSVGRLLSVVATAATQPETYGDSTVHLADSTGFMLATSVLPGAVAAGSEARFVGRIAERGGQRVLQASMVFVGGEGSVPDPVALETGMAATAQGGVLDAALVSISGAVIVEAGRNAAGDVRMMVDDGSGVVEIFLDRSIPFAPDAPLVRGVVVEATGFLVPTGTGAWRLRPREDADLDVSVATVTIAEARDLEPGRLVAIEGIALAGWQSFADSTLHVTDPTGSIRGFGIPPAFVFAGDRVRLVGVIAIRDLQSVLTDVALSLPGGQGSLPAPVELTTAVAASANDGALDAGLVSVAGVVVTDTATVGADFHATVEDASATPLEVIVDRDSGVNRNAFTPGARFDLVGVLVPAPGGGRFRLKPRMSTDVRLR